MAEQRRSEVPVAPADQANRLPGPMQLVLDQYVFLCQRILKRQREESVGEGEE